MASSAVVETSTTDRNQGFYTLAGVGDLAAFVDDSVSALDHVRRACAVYIDRPYPSTMPGMLRIRADSMPKLRQATDAVDAAVRELLANEREVEAVYLVMEPRKRTSGMVIELDPRKGMAGVGARARVLHAWNKGEEKSDGTSKKQDNHPAGEASAAAIAAQEEYAHRFRGAFEEVAAKVRRTMDTPGAPAAVKAEASLVRVRAALGVLRFREVRKVGNTQPWEEFANKILPRAAKRGTCFIDPR
jgi:hypothetical protein